MNTPTSLISPTDFFSSLGITPDQLSHYLQTNSNFKSNFYGYVSEIVLRDALLAQPGITAVEKINDSNLEIRGDLLITLTDGSTRTVECKRVARGNSIRMTTTASRTITTISGAVIPSTRLVEAGKWDILALVQESSTEPGKWSFKFCKNASLPRSTKHPDLLRDRIHIQDLRTYSTILEALLFN